LAVRLSALFSATRPRRRRPGPRGLLLGFYFFEVWANRGLLLYFFEARINRGLLFDFFEVWINRGLLFDFLPVIWSRECNDLFPL
jgi:hypothetical protein